MSTNPFLNGQQELYGTSQRLARRTGALHGAKIQGRPVPEVISELPDPERARATVIDVGCGRGSTTAHLAQRWNPVLLAGIDLSHALLVDARRRLPQQARARFLRADFHALPLAEASVDVVVAAFCLYHAPQPQRVIVEFARCLRPGGQAVLVTKSADSYRELDELVTAAGLDPHATRRPSLYETFHSGNAEHITTHHLAVLKTVNHQHVFRFRDAAHTARYLTTTPKYDLGADEQAITTALRPLVGQSRVTATSTVTYVLAERR
ncbi:class I SAM-dependent methyltransferase [Saccharopolyspora phatthalungensis]|uniref:Ubiquinone/menaquinone biosynthesis C-methylase UbiE n=1 Tax=Saccharopolyspora phatthalungensis TaxID=664693 RepID=A0A840QCT6_9PSEU|nr:class I SAM-dependent methyltransferase [Saccharopolyspora phatthalungensis]MBB5158206.1 ubiquinone/menaquinone biosynthesis C-methylase UbiE [Saccharopolyspora phatthalungensis]